MVGQDTHHRQNDKSDIARLVGLTNERTQPAPYPRTIGRMAANHGSPDHWIDNIKPNSAETFDAALRWIPPAIDCVIIVLASARAFATEVAGDAGLMALAAPSAALWTLAAHSAGFFDSGFLRFSGRRMAGLIALWLLVTSAVWSGAALMDSSPSTESWLDFLSIGAVGLLLTRLTVWALAGRLSIRGTACKQIVVICPPADIARATARIAAERPGARIAAFIHPSWSSMSIRSPAGKPMPDGVRADEIVLVMDMNSPILSEYCARLREHPIAVSVMEPLSSLGLIRVQSRPLSGGAQITKRAFDIVLSTGFLLLCAPLMLVLAALVKLSDPKGPVFYLQPRHGFNNTTFITYKFRSLRTANGDVDGARQVTRNDPRVTRIGRFLRASSLDELPQLVNVLVGDMSLVGPRPHPIPLNQKIAAVLDGSMARHRVKPGITGLAQVNGFRGETDTLEKMKGRIEFDCLYIEHWSLWLDMKILLRTAFAVIKHDNAY